MLFVFLVLPVDVVHVSRPPGSPSPVILKCKFDWFFALCLVIAFLCIFFFSHFQSALGSLELNGFFPPPPTIS